MVEPPQTTEDASIAELSVELLEQAAALAGERLGTPIRAALSRGAKLFMLAGLALLAFTLGSVFLGVGIGLLIGMAPASMRWWICLLVAGGCAAIGAVLAWVVAGAGKKKEPRDGPDAGSGGEG